MFRETHPQKKIACTSPALARFTLAADAQKLSFPDASRDFDLVNLGFGYLAGAATSGAHFAVALPCTATLIADHRAPQRDGPDRTAPGFLERDHEIGFDVAASYREFLLGKASAT